MLTAARFENLKALHNIGIPLQQLTMLVGPNGVGKSTMLDGIDYGMMLAERFPQSTMVDDLLARNFYKKTNYSNLLFNKQKSLIITLSRNKSAFSIEISKQNTPSFITILDKETSISFKGNTPIHSKNLLDKYFNIQRQRLIFNIDNIISPSKNVAGIPELSADGSNLATLLNYIIIQRDETIEKIEYSISRIVNGFKRLYVENTPIDNEVGFSFSALINGTRVPADHLSEGTVLLIAICTLLYSPKCPRLLLLDDIDRGLHPKAQLELIDLLHRLLKEQPDLQIIATAHSDTILLGCAPEEVVRLDFGPDGGAVVVPTTGDPRYMTPTEVTEEWFGISHTGMDDLIQRYAMLAGDDLRSEEEEQEVQNLAARLAEMDAKGLPPIRPRRA